MKMNVILSFPKLILFVLATLTLSWAPVDLNRNNNYEINIINKKESKLDPIILLENQAFSIYEAIKLSDVGLSFNVFEKAYIGFLNLQNAQKISEQSFVLSIADFDQSSKNKRLWIVDLEHNRLLLNTWVSHGRGSGGEIASKFSNINNSHQSSLGFYITGEVYYGKHGRSLRLDGMDKGFNNKARERAIVLHGASYVSHKAIKSLNRLGLSHGCPAVPLELTNEIIDIIKEKTVLYIHANSPIYNSVYLNSERAGKQLVAYNNLKSISSEIGI